MNFIKKVIGITFALASFFTMGCSSMHRALLYQRLYSLELPDKLEGYSSLEYSFPVYFWDNDHVYIECRRPNPHIPPRGEIPKLYFSVNGIRRDNTCRTRITPTGVVQKIPILHEDKSFGSHHGGNTGIHNFTLLINEDGLRYLKENEFKINVWVNSSYDPKRISILQFCNTLSPTIKQLAVHDLENWAFEEAQRKACADAQKK